MQAVRAFFEINHTIILFVYGLTFFVLGLVIFLQSRRHSRLRLARDLRWLAAFGILHGIYEWGDIFIPIQATYLPAPVISIFWALHVVLLTLSFLCLLMFGIVSLENRVSRGRTVVVMSGVVWLVFFILLKSFIADERGEHQIARTLARYCLCFPGGLLAAYGLRYQAQRSIAPLNIRHIYRVLRIAGWSLIAYAVFAGLLVRPGDFFPTNLLNHDLIEGTLGLPIEVLRSLTGLILTVTLIRVLEVFEIELDQMIESMEIERIQAAERDRIGQEIHDGAIQGVYSASLILESIQPLLEADSESGRRVQQARSVLNAVNMDLRSYMVSLRAQSPPDPLIPSLKTLIANPRFHGLLDIDLTYEVEPQVKPTQVHHILAIIQESLSNTLRHAHASRARIAITRANGSFQVCVADDGRGFSTQATSPSYGLRSMRDRARLLGGQLAVESQPGKGTTVMLRLPDEKIV